MEAGAAQRSQLSRLSFAAAVGDPPLWSGALSSTSPALATSRPARSRPARQPAAPLRESRSILVPMPTPGVSPRASVLGQRL